VGYDHVDELGDVFLWRRLADQEPHIFEGVRSPRYQDQETDENGTDGVDVPDDTSADNGHDKTENIDGNVIAVVDKEDMHGWISPVDEAINAE
jgi:hypothetical protein